MTFTPEAEGTRRFARPVLCLVLDRSVCTLPVEEAVRAAAAEGVDWIQLRERGLDARPMLDWLSRTGEIARAENPDVRLIVNRRIDVALAGGADGVHLGFDALAVAEARALLSPGALVGASTHTVSEVADAARAGADYVHLAPIFAPRSKAATRASLGRDALREAAVHPTAVIAQGGLAADNAREVIEAGAKGIAVTGAILMSDDPARQTRRLRDAIDASR